MKLTETIIERMLELSSIEGSQNVQYLNDEGVKLRDNLLTLFESTDNPAAHAIINDIMNEAGYPMFENVEGKNASSSLISKHKRPDQIMSDDEFMDLLPANGRIH